MIVGLSLLLMVLLLLLMSQRARARMGGPLKAVLAVLMVLIAVLIVVLASSDFLAIDRCLDGGGRWNYETRTCEH